MVGASRWGGEYEAILELLPKGKSGSPVKAWTAFCSYKGHFREKMAK